MIDKREEALINVIAVLSKWAERRARVMIENKVITIRKTNTFDKGWTFVAPYRTAFTVNKRFRALNISDIVRRITKSEKVNLILCEPCLSSQIVKELEWVNRYIAVDLIAKNSAVAKYYSQLKFRKVEIDSSIDFNYMAVLGETNLFTLIAEDYVSVDGNINSVYFEKADAAANYDFLTNAESVVFVDENNDKDYAAPFNACIKANVPTAYVVGVHAFKQGLVHKFIGLNATLLCSQNVRNGILYTADDGRIFCATLTSKGIYVSVEIESANYYIGQPFESLKCADVIDVKNIPQGRYVCDNGSIKPFKTVNEKVIDRSVDIDNMEDFVAERFDSSETDGHNRYCTEAKAVVYNFTLVPPIFATDKISDIYSAAEKVYAEWKKNFEAVDMSEILRGLKDMESSECGLYRLCDGLVAFDKRLAKIISRHDYKDYYTEIRAVNDLLCADCIDGYCKELFVKLNTEVSDTKFEKLDREIAGYMQTVAEKRALIEKGEAFHDMRTIERLEKKIADLTAVKQRFLGSASARSDKQSEAFSDFCRQVVNGEFVEEERGEVDSIGNVLASKETTKIEKLEAFIKAYLYGLNRFVISAKNIIKQFGSVDIPTDYVVYEQDGKRVIAIDSEREYYDTENIRKHFDLHCRARR